MVRRVEQLGEQIADGVMDHAVSIRSHEGNTGQERAVRLSTARPGRSGCRNPFQSGFQEWIVESCRPYQSKMIYFCFIFRF